MSTNEIDAYCYAFIVEHKGKPAFLNYMGFPATACISLNEEVIHGIPSDRIVQPGDLVSVDLGINLDGYYSDAARTFIAGGKSTRKMKNWYVSQTVSGSRYRRSKKTFGTNSRYFSADL